MQRSIEGQLLLEEVQARGYAEFEHGISDGQIEQLVERYADFTLAHPDPEPETMVAMLPDPELTPDFHKHLDDLNRPADTQREWHKYRTNAEQFAKPDGYTNRAYQEDALKRAGIIIPSEDPKEFYHHTPGHYGSMVINHQEYGWGPLPPEVAKLDAAFGTIHRKAVALTVKVCGLIEETHPEIRRIITPDALQHSPLRLLFYHPTLAEEYGAGHYDKGTLTFQLAESHEGLRVAPNAESPLQPIRRASEKAVFFPAIGLGEHVPDTAFQPGWHDITRVDALNDGRNVPPKASEVCARWALIFFANNPTLPLPDKSATHQRAS